MDPDHTSTPQHICDGLDRAGVPCCYIDDKGMILQANATWLRIFSLQQTGRSVFECMSSAQNDLIHVLSQGKFEKAIKLEARWQLPTSMPRWFTWRITCEPDASYFIVLQEITSLKMVQNELLFAKNHAESSLDQLKQNMQLKSAFLSNMSHEIRTPLNGLLGILSLFKDTSLDAEQSDYVTLMEKSGKAMSEVINDVLDLSKLEANKTEFLPQKIELRVLIEELVVLAASTLNARCIDLSWTVDRRLPDEVLVDGVRLRQVLNNLVNNAVKFTEAGEVHITVHILHREAHMLHVQFDVSDTGMGIDVNRLTHIFEPFTQVLSSKRLDATGSGLGLAICKKLVDAMGGDLSVASKLGEGSTFSFILPMEAISDVGDEPMQFKGSKRVDVFTRHPKRVHLIKELFETRGVPVHLHKELSSWLDKVDDEALLFVDVQDLSLEDFSYSSQGLKPGQHLIALVRMGESAASYYKHGMVSEVLNLPLRQASLLRLVQRLYPTDMEEVHQETRTIQLNRFDIAGLEEDSFTSLDSFSSLVQEITAKPVNPATTILLAEDHPVNQLITTKMLKGLGYGVKLCEHGVEACEALEEGDYVAVLMDCQMPVLDGYSATMRIREREHTLRLPRVPIIGLSAYAFDTEKSRALEAGMDAYLSKPVGRDELARTLIHWIAQRVETHRISTFEALSFSQEPLIDEVRLGVLIESCGDLEFVAELVDTYKVASLRSFELLRALVSAWSRKDADNVIKLQAHSMKGSSDSMGLSRLTHCMDHLEHHASEIEPEAFASYLEHVEIVSSLSIRALGQWLTGVTE